MRTVEVAVVVLAAGAGTRFRTARTSGPSARSVVPSPTVGADLPGAKLLAPVAGRPVLQHVLDRVALLAPAATVVVLGHDAETVERGIEWRDERLVRNPAPERGISSSVVLGLDAAASSLPAARAALIVLGDQPRVGADVMRRLISEVLDTDTGARPFVAPRYSRGDSGNPLLVRRYAWPLAASLRGDRGFGSLIAARPELVATVAIEGANPDVDTPTDLAALEGDQSSPRRRTRPIRPYGGRGSV
jgi:molybdenum cofactor cytidylyltransferase